jgi:glycine/D-amino acid oxidase-like deaminating enzyme
MMENISKPRQRICVIGGGIAGLSCAYALSGSSDVTLLEQHNRIGMDAFAIRVDLPGDADVRVDIPLRVFNPAYYRQLSALYEVGGGIWRGCVVYYVFTLSSFLFTVAPRYTNGTMRPCSLRIFKPRGHR